MPRTPIERRDNTVLEAVLSVQEGVSEIKEKIAVNSTKISSIEDHLKTLNGKVATQEVRQQEQAGTQALLAASITTLQRAQEQNQSILREHAGKAVWGVIGIILMLFYYLLTHNGFPQFLN